MTGPSVTLREGSNERVISSWFVRDDTNTAREISAAYVRDTTNTPRLVYNPSGSVALAVTVSPPGASGFSHGTGIATTNVANVATATGGTPPYTYAWNLQSYTNPNGPPTADSPTSDTTTFTQTAIDPDTSVSAVWIATVTDDDGNIANSDEFTTYFSDISGP